MGVTVEKTGFRTAFKTQGKKAGETLVADVGESLCGRWRLRAAARPIRANLSEPILTVRGPVQRHGEPGCVGL